MPAKKLNDFMKAKEKARKSGAKSFTYKCKGARTATTYYRHETWPPLLNTDKKRKKPFVTYSKTKPRKGSFSFYGERIARAIREARAKSPRTDKWVKIEGTGVECNFYRQKCRKVRTR